jgi:8-oxo-dGTP pyrophosphatase MutT (NUDIX family)/RimJ/RimL family protein N-acetyltransferase
MADTTWDGLAIADDWPNGATIVVRRTDGHILLLHRAHYGPDFGGDWAWTPPAGARHPGEAIQTGALRELAEEAGLTGVPITAIELSTRWGLFAAEVGPDTAVTLIDVEHDQYQWVRSADALAMCRPHVVAGNIRRVIENPAPAVTFRPLERTDLARMVAWQAEPHVARWWNDPVADPAGAETKYGPRIDGTAPTLVDIVLIDGEPGGFIQMTPLAADPEYLATARHITEGGDDAVSIDYAIGLPGAVGRGIGSRMIWAYLRDIVLDRLPGTRFVVAAPESANIASVRACEKIGFHRIVEFYASPDAARQSLFVLNRARVLG